MLLLLLLLGVGHGVGGARNHSQSGAHPAADACGRGAARRPWHGPPGRGTECRDGREAAEVPDDGLQLPAALLLAPRPRAHSRRAYAGPLYVTFVIVARFCREVTRPSTRRSGAGRGEMEWNGERREVRLPNPARPIHGMMTVRCIIEEVSQQLVMSCAICRCFCGIETMSTADHSN
jgi:hypothetical protein